jgi:valyl-tRNA synthetase
MDKVYNHKDVEEKIYKFWETSGYFKPEVNPKGKPYCIILPPPNANGALHFGHAMFAVEDVLIRYHRMKGDAALWLPGSDHAGIETQFVFEKKLKNQGKSRLDFDQKTLYEMIHEYVQEHRGGIEKQLRRLGFSLDWSREKYTLDPDIIKLVHKTFKRMYDEGLLYRDYKLVNYCTFDGTSFSDLEIVHEEKVSPLYYIKYGPLVLATTRPETKFGDTAVAVHPSDARYKKYIGKELEIETVLGKAKIKVIADESVDPKFGTGVVKIIPAHDFNDFETGKRHNLLLKQVIGFDGKMNHYAGKFEGMYVGQARRAVVEEMKAKGLIEKIDENYKNRVGLCYKCKHVLEPLPLEQWFVKVKPLAEKAIDVVKKGKIKITPANFEKQYYLWLENLRDWNVSRQIVWGIQIPAWKNSKTGEWIVTDGETPEGKDLVQDKDTLDTWFSSGQWPYLTLKTGKSGDFEKFYPTSVMETGYDLLKAWVSRMIMLGIYVTGKIPFEDVLFHGLVNDPYGKKMSKSKGNVVNPLEIVDQYGADAVRFALIYGNATGNDQALSYSKLDASRKFTNKLWNIARFVEFSRKNISSAKKLSSSDRHVRDLEWTKKINKWAKETSRYIEEYNFNFAAEKLYEYIWHGFADYYVEEVKTRLSVNALGVLEENFKTVLKLLHPFIPFVTEEIYQRLGFGKSIMIDKWPQYEV